MTKPTPVQSQPQESRPSGQVSYMGSEVYRRLSVKGTEGIVASVVVKSMRGYVWISITPPFTWEAILEPRKVDELIHILELVREDAKKVAAPLNKRPNNGGNAAIREIASGDRGADKQSHG